MPWNTDGFKPVDINISFLLDHTQVPNDKAKDTVR